MASNPKNVRDNIIKLRGKIKPTFVSVFFILFMIFFLVQGIRSCKHHPVESYNVGRADADNVTGMHEGIVLRDETVYLAKEDGEVSYFVTSGNRLSSGGLICTIDADGTLMEEMHRIYFGQEIISGPSQKEIQNTILSAGSIYDPMDFQTAYDMKAEIRSVVFTRLLNDGGDVVTRLTDASYSSVYTDDTGFILLWEDGLENRAVSELHHSDFVKNGQKKLGRYSGDQIERGDFLYKETPSDAFTLNFLLSEDEYREVQNKKSLSIRTSDGLEITGDFHVEVNGDMEKCGVLSFTKYGNNFMKDRFVSFQILDKSISGYKIPESAITTKSFFVVDEDYIVETETAVGVLVLEDGEAVLKPMTVYKRPEDEKQPTFIIGEHQAYIYSDDLTTGTVLVAPVLSGGTITPGDTLTLSVKASVEGVYQVNSGYCVFKPVVRIKNSIDTDFCIVAPNVRYGIASYDRIVLDASEVKENQILLE